MAHVPAHGCSRLLLGQSNGFGNLPITNGIKNLAHVPEQQVQDISAVTSSQISQKYCRRNFFFQSKAESLTLVKPETFQFSKALLVD